VAVAEIFPLESAKGFDRGLFKFIQLWLQIAHGRRLRRFV